MVLTDVCVNVYVNTFYVNLTAYALILNHHIYLPF